MENNHTLRLPAEWEKQEAIWLSWPLHEKNWPDRLPAIQKKFAEIAAAISRLQTVRINAAATHHETVRTQLNDAKASLDDIELFNHPTDDVWCRDHGPIFVHDEKNGTVSATDWEFNGWGGRFGPCDLDNAVPHRIAESLNIPHIKGGLVLEGGAIEGNGAGTLITTEAVLLNENRNPGKTKEEVEAILSDVLGIENVIWLPSGIEGDDTGGHVDDMVRFIDKRTVIACTEDDPMNPNYSVLDKNHRILAEEKSLETINLPMPEPIGDASSRLPVAPASYANFLILNDAILLPVFGQPMNDAKAMGIVANAFPGRRVLPIDCRELVAEGGALHCISMQQPAP